MSKVIGIYVKFYYDRSPNMVMTRDPGCKIRKFYCSPNSILNFRKRYQIWGKLAQEQKSYRQEAKLRVENTPPPMLIMVKHTAILDLPQVPVRRNRHTTHKNLRGGK